MKHNKAAAGLAASFSLVLAACGGGGGAAPLAPPQANISIAGLGTGKSVALSITNVATGSVMPLTANAASAVKVLDPGTYTVAVTQHPQRQLCQVVQGGRFVVDEADASVAVSCHTTYLNDTGVTALPSGGTYPGVDGQFGRDAAYLAGQGLSKLGAGRVGYDFTKICADGDPVSAAGTCKQQSYVNEWACVRDNVTQLMWDLRSFKDTDAPPAGANGGPAAWCGVQDSAWHKASTHELISIVDSAFVDPKELQAKVDVSVFPNVLADIYQSGEKDINGRDWYVDFNNYGTVSSTPDVAVGEAHVLYAAALQGSRVNSTQDFTVTDASSAYVIVDGGRDLIWLFEKAPEAKTWQKALSSVAAVNAAGIGGQSDWRLPNKNELDSVVDRSKASPKVHDGMLEGVDATIYQSAFWTNTKWFETASINVWRVDFTTGDVTLRDENTTARTVYVRNRVVLP